jgi:hypothetical protein
MLPLAQPPKKDERSFDDWMYRLWRKLVTSGQIAWSVVDKTGSNLTDIETRNHADLQNLNTASYTHLTATNHTDLTDGGATTLHKHDHSLQDNLNSTDYTHLTAANHTDLTDGGLTTLHKHLSRTIGAETLPGVTYSGSDIIVDGTGVYWINTETYYTGEMTRITPDGATFTITNIETTYYLTADYNAGVPILACSSVYPDESDGTIALIAKIIRTGTTTFHTTWRDHLAVGLPNKLQKAIEHILGPVATSGLVISDTGVRYLTISAGNISLGGIETPLAAIDTSGADTYRFIYYDGAAWQGSSITQLSNTQYQSVTGLQSLTGSRYAINWIWRGIEDQKHAYVLLGEGDYSYAEAIDSSPPVPPAWITDHSALLGRILFQRNDNTAIVQQVSALGYALVGAIQHNNTTNKQGGTTDEYYHLTSAQSALIPSGVPTVGQVPTATSATTATWQTPSGGSSTNWPIVKHSIGVGETCTISAGFQLIVASHFENSGTLVNSGEFYLI